PFPELGTGATGVVGEQLVQLAPGTGEAVDGVALDLRPGQVERVPATDNAQATIAEPAVRSAGGHPHPVQFGQGPGGEPVATDLVPREGRLVQQQHVQAGDRQVVRSGGTCGACADDDDVCVIVAAAHAYHLFHSSSVSFSTAHTSWPAVLAPKRRTCRR